MLLVGHSPCRPGLLQAASSGPKYRFLILPSKLLEGVLQVVKHERREGRSRKEDKGQGSAFEGGALRVANLRGLPAAPAVDDARFDPSIILSDAAKVGV